MREGPDTTPADGGLRALLDGVAAQLHDDDPVAFHGTRGGADCRRCHPEQITPDQWEVK